MTTQDLNGQPLAVGSRVRLFSGSEVGTITKLGPARALVRWDTGTLANWATNCLMVVADGWGPPQPAPTPPLSYLP